ncbi:MAG TPA: peptidoglycan editing factor PgeF [Streptosporangiaceae bacterium]|nr:peptidoglycan editing factor PgeF [Streptosporangiaceae bacterium]
MSGRSGQDAGSPWQPFELCKGVLALFTGRGGGVSRAPFAGLNLSTAVGDDPAATVRNRQLVAAACGLGAAGMSWMHQVHGCGVSRMIPGQAPPTADAMFTDAPDLALGVLVADCAPVLIADPVARLVGAAHAGRDGMAAGVVPALVAALTGAGADPGRMHAVIGPAICGACYEVPAQLRDQVAAAVPAAGSVTAAGTAGIDIRAGVETQLAAAGVGQVSGDRRCTAETADLYSYRRDGRTGRFAGLIWLTS